MALERICDVTGDRNAKVVSFSVGGVTWKIDLSTKGETMLHEALASFVEKARLVTVDQPDGLIHTGGDNGRDDDDEEDPGPPGEPEPPAPDAPTLPEADDGYPALDRTQKNMARQWALTHWKTCGANKPPAARGSVRRIFQIGWIKAGSPPTK